MIPVLQMRKLRQMGKDQRGFDLSYGQSWLE